MKELQLLFLAIATLILLCQSITEPEETRALQAFRSRIQDPNNRLLNWKGDDPCGNGTNWEGVFCAPDAYNTYRVIELRLLNHDLSGTLAPELGNLTKLEILDVMWNNIVGSIPPTIGKLRSLKLLLLNGNILTGHLPKELGNLTMMNRIQIDQNQISGPVPSSFANLVNAKHFHMNNNSLSGSIPPELGRLPNLLHLLLDNNNLTGSLPPQLSNISTLNIMQLDNNHFNKATIPSQYGNMTQLLKLSLRNCGLQGSIPDFSGNPNLSYIDISNNQLSDSIPNSSFSQSVTSIDLSGNLLTGMIPSSFGKLPLLQALILRNNKLNGSVSASLAAGKNFSQSTTILVLDLQQNNFTDVDASLIKLSGRSYNLWLSNNPVCYNPPPQLYGICAPNSIVVLSQMDSSSSASYSSCNPKTCSPGIDELIPLLALDDKCLCASPIQVDYRLKSPGFIFFETYKDVFYNYISRGINLTLDQVDVSTYSWEPGPRLRMKLKLFPVDDAIRKFNLSEIQRLYQTFTTWNIPDASIFGPYEVLGFTPPYGVVIFPSSKKKSSSLSGGAIAGILIGSIAATAAIVVALMYYVFRKYRRPRVVARKSTIDKSGLKELIEIAGVKYFTFDELADATDGFSPSKQVGQGGYGRVYRGVFENGHIVAIKRAEEDSLQGAKEFYNEIEILSRVHHRNLVPLVGYCNDEGEQMLVYEFITGGTLQERLSPTAKVPLDFATRLRIAINSARGILYLHTEANPPIIHRDIKASNILLDERNIAKVADFGLSRLAPLPDLDGFTLGHVSTLVKGTPGYLDPEYYLTHKLSDKSDVYSFGVVLLELLTGMQPISQGKNLVREVNSCYEGGKVLSVVDQIMGTYPSETLESFMKLALQCCKSDPNLRPPMSEVVRDLEDLLRSMPWDDQPSISLELFEKSESKRDSKSLVSDSSMPSNVDQSTLFSQTIHHVTPR